MSLKQNTRRARRLFPWTAVCLLAGMWITAACSVPDLDSQTETITATATRSGNLTQFIPTLQPPTPSPTQPDPATATPLPSPTPTPRTHTVQKGEDMFGIAWQYRISLEELKTANPEIDPRFLSIGAQLTVPHSLTPDPELQSADVPPEPTPIPIELGPLSCHRSRDGSAWCFQAARNPNAMPLEGLSAVFRVTQNEGAEVLETTAILPLDLLPPGGVLPFAAFFPAGLFEDPDAPLVGSGELTTALPSPQDGRYLPVAVEDVKVLLDERALSALVSANIHVEAPASQVWVVAVAYGAGGKIVGVRRWESQTGQVTGGDPLPVLIQLYSAGPAIEQVEVYAEARP